MASEFSTPESEFSTLESLQKYDMEITETVMNRVRDADPNEGRCLVTNATIPIDYCRCISMKEEKIVCVYKIHHHPLCAQIHIISRLPGMGLEHETLLFESGHALKYLLW